MSSEDSLRTDHTLLATLSAEAVHAQWDEGWRRFFDRYEPIVISVALREGLAEAQAEEVLQETMVHLVRVFREGRYQQAKGSFRSFLLGTVRWKIGDARRRWARSQAGVESIDLEPATDVMPLHEKLIDPGASPDEAIEHSLRLGIVERALEGLVSYGWVGQQRVDIFAALVTSVKSATEVAAEYGVTPNSVHQIRHQVQTKLRQMIACLEAGADPAAFRT